MKNANSPYFLCQYFLKSQQFFVIYYILLLDVIFMLVQKFILPYIKALGFGAPPAWPHRPKSSTARLPLPSHTSTRSVRWPALRAFRMQRLGRVSGGPAGSRVHLVHVGRFARLGLHVSGGPCLRRYGRWFIPRSMLIERDRLALYGKGRSALHNKCAVWRTRIEL